ncbi:VWA domain-containing protein, partial [bacterium]|nr:VWA domain-containing protein [bacterium]
MRRALLALALAALPTGLFGAVATSMEACPKVSLDIFLLVDTSGSMEGTWQTLATALDRFAADMGPDDRLTLATFSHEGTYQVLDRVAGDQVTKITARLRAIQIERPRGTDILGALRRAAPEIRSRGGGMVDGMARVPILLVLTDGQDTNEEVIEVLVTTGISAGDSDTDTEGANIAHLYRVTEDTLRGWADLWADALGGKDGDYPLSMLALFDHPIPDSLGRPIPGTGGVRRHFVEMVRLRPDLNLHIIDLERGMTLPIGVICAVPTHLDFGNIPGTLSEPREVRFMVRGRSGVLRLPRPDEVRFGFLGDPLMLRGGAGAVMEAQAGSTPGSLALRLRLINPDNLSPAVYADNKVTLALPEREGAIIFLVPDRLTVSFRTDLEPTECPIQASGPTTVVKGGPEARRWEAERTLTPDCLEAAGAEGMTVRAFGLPRHAVIVVEDGFGQEVARLSRRNPTGRLPAIGDLTARLVFP